MRRTVVAVLAAALGVAAYLSPSAGAAPKPSVPVKGTSAAGLDPASVAGSYRLPSGGWAVPVRAKSPDWFTPQLQQRVASGKRTVAPAGAVGPDVPLSGYVGIRPGSEMIFPYGCTMNFIFGSPGRYSIGTAGHCVDKVGQPVTLLTIAPGTRSGRSTSSS